MVGPLGPGPEGVLRTAAGEADFALTSAHYYLLARSRLGRELPARFVAVVHDRSPLAAFVAADGPLHAPRDLAGRRVAASTAPWFDDEYQMGLRLLGLAPAVHVAPSPSGERPSMVDGEVDVIGSWDEAIVVIRRRAGLAVRAIAFGPDIYSTGLIVRDGVSPDVVGRTVQAFSDALRRQVQDPTPGLDELCRRFPILQHSDVLEEWSILSRYLNAERPGVMEADRWSDTLAHAAETHGLAAPEVSEVCYEALLRESVGASSARGG